ncbi:hypothetical protein N802_00740 [Knoellia sinensis KCTC 19936]|uniref:Secreted protein n=1 Tax=Knoellia sinensis KCTC 19936 TaxID=1385520 RepID=A0A0A0JG10_9MICO|nr:hypothetical protein [Knoellia sinensis]KGN34992.1 hypothetical protein N802_00740 [Knoellia sinensis KCTC 19936]
MTSRSTMLRRTALTTAVTGAAAALVIAGAPAASAAPIGVGWDVNVTTTVKKLNQEIAFPQTRFPAQVDIFGDGSISGNLALPDATSTLKLGSLPLAKVTLGVVPTKPVSGKLTGLDVVANQEFNIHIKKIQPLGLPINLVGSNCKTATPVQSQLTGTLTGLFDPYTLKGEYTIPKFKNCGLSTPLINLLIPGEGNTMTANFSGFQIGG